MHLELPSRRKDATVQSPASPTNDLTPLPVAPAPETPVVELRPLHETPAAPLVALGLTGPAHAEAPGAAVTVRVLARLSNGERIEVGTHADETAAKAEATALMRYLREAGTDWPFLNGRFVRPEAIVSIDIVN